MRCFVAAINTAVSLLHDESIDAAAVAVSLKRCLVVGNRLMMTFRFERWRFVLKMDAVVIADGCDHSLLIGSLRRRLIDAAVAAAAAAISAYNCSLSSL